MVVGCRVHQLTAITIIPHEFSLERLALLGLEAA